MLDPNLRAWLNDAAEHARLRNELPSRVEARPWALFGSSVLLLYGLREEIGDIDVFVAQPVWSILAHTTGWSRQQPDPLDPPYLERVANGQGKALTVHAFHAWTARDPEVEPYQCRRAAVEVAGWWCTPLEIIRMHKMMSLPKFPNSARHTKHFADIQAIDARSYDAARQAGYAA